MYMYSHMYTSSYSINDPLAYNQLIVSSTCNTLAIIIVSLMDGYAVDQKLVLIFLATFHYGYDYLQSYFDTTDSTPSTRCT